MANGKSKMPVLAVIAAVTGRPRVTLNHHTGEAKIAHNSVSAAKPA